MYPFGDGSVDYIFSPVRTPSNQLYIEFVADNAVNHRGWLVEYKIGKKSELQFVIL